MKILKNQTIPHHIMLLNPCLCALTFQRPRHLKHPSPTFKITCTGSIDETKQLLKFFWISFGSTNNNRNLFFIFFTATLATRLSTPIKGNSPTRVEVYHDSFPLQSHQGHYILTYLSVSPR